MLSHDDHVAVAVSGGKDSLVLLSILFKLTSRFPNSKLTAITIDEGINDYRDEAIKLAEEYCKKFGIEQIVVSFKELFGLTLDELIKRSRSALSECSYCGILRRRALDEAGKIVKADKIATAHNLDDEIQTFMLNIFHGGTDRMARSNSHNYAKKKVFIRRIKPMCEIYEKEIVLYAYLSQIKFQSMPCPYACSSLRNDMRNMINSIEEKHPGVKYTIYRTKEKMIKTLNGHLNNHEQLKICEICSAPASADVCEVCKLLCSIPAK